jgi:penicillin-binding protein A
VRDLGLSIVAQEVEVRSLDQGWREYQWNLRRNERRKSLAKRLSVWILCVAGLSLVAFFVFKVAPRISVHPTEASLPPKSKKVQPLQEETFSEQDLCNLLSRVDLRSPLGERVLLSDAGMTFTAQTTIDPALQDFIFRLFEQSRTVKAAAAILNPLDGRILALASHGDDDPSGSICLRAGFPAASLFKIVASAAALEAAGFTPEKPVSFVGGKYTLYKKQLASGTSRYATTTTFREAFADSINPVFGKLGIYDLGQETIARYAGKFLFNQTIPFDLPIEMSAVEVPEDPFGIAEITSGFNKRTLISPIHAALMTAAIANDGTMMRPWLVTSVVDPSGETVFQGHPSALARPIDKKTAGKLRVLMQDTVKTGTLRKTFRPLKGRKSLRDVEVGAKTGSINDKEGRYRLDWATVYAIPKERNQPIVVTVLAVHGEKIGARAGEIARRIIEQHLGS